MHGNPDIYRYAKPTGRPKGRRNNVTIAAQEMARKIVEDPIYRQNLLERAQRGELGQMKPVLWSYAYGRPATDVTLRVQAANADAEQQASLYDLTDDELIDRAERITAVLRAAADPRKAAAALAEAEEKFFINLVPQVHYRPADPSPSAVATEVRTDDERERTVLPTDVTSKTSTT